MRLILASQSPARLSVLRSAGVEPVVRVSGVDEDALVASLRNPTPEETVVALSAAKAEAIEHDDECVVVGCDSMLLFEGELSIENVAYASGFSSLSQFYEQFRAAYGVTPREMRAKYLHGI